MVHSYADSKIVHLCNHAAAKEGMPFFGPMIVINGLWSVMRVKLQL